MSAERGEVRMVAIDIDGTLLGEDGQVSPRNLRALLAAEAAGIQIVIATGRRHSYAWRVLHALGLHHASVMISSNGTVTRTFGCGDTVSQLLSRSHLPRATALWLCAQAGTLRDSLVFTFDRVGPGGDDARGALVVEKMEQLTGSIGRWMAANEPYIERVDAFEPLLATAADEPIQAMLCGPIARMRDAEALLVGRMGVVAAGHWESTGDGAPLTLHRTEYADRDLSILDILPAGCSKGAALRTLAASRGVEPAQILAIGDNWNDLSMLEAAGFPVLMENAPAELTALARERGWTIGRSNREHGVAEAIEAILPVEIRPVAIPPRAERS